MRIFLHVKIRNERDSSVYDRYFENPLTKNLESYDDNGKIEKVVSSGKEEYIDLRFKLPEGVDTIVRCCFR